MAGVFRKFYCHNNLLKKSGLCTQAWCYMYSIENSDMYTFDKETERSLNFADLVTEDIKIKMLQIVIEDHSQGINPD